MSVDRDTLLILAGGGRALAESACRGGYRVRVYDGFCDRDTSAVARCRRVHPGFPQLDANAFIQEIASLPGSLHGVVYGGGLEEAAPLLRRLSARWRVFGNAPSVLELLQNPRRFFPLLDSLGIPYPEVRFTPPYAVAGKSWLIKRAGRCGGLGTAYFDPGFFVADSASYYQRYIEGTVMSVLFIADGERHRTLGYNRLGMKSSNPPAPFLYTGAVGQVPLSDAQRRPLEGMVARLVSRLGLRGVNGLDFILNEDGILVLDLNPRPTATLELYEHLLRDGWIKHHIRACLGELPPVPRDASAEIRGHQIVYAPRSLEIPVAMKWPQWAKDRPEAGAGIVAGQPLCSLFAQGGDTREVEALLRQYQGEILQLLGAFTHPAAPRKVAV